MITCRLYSMVCLLLFNNVFGQDYFYQEIKFGDYAVGFRTETFTDYGRQGFDNSVVSGRKINLGIWYPASGGTGKSMKYADYLDLYAIISGSGATKPVDDLFTDFLGNYKIDTSLFSGHRRQILSTGMRSRLNATPAAGRFPLLVYPDNVHLQNVFCEFLASYGFIVVSPVLKGTYSSDSEYNVTGLETSAQDIQSTIHFLYSKYRYGPQFALMATGFNASVCLNVLMRNSNALQYISMEGGITTGFEEKLIQQTPYFDLRLCDRPMLIMHAPHPDVKPELTYKYEYADRIYQSYPQTSEFYFTNFGLWEKYIKNIFPNANRTHTAESYRYATASVLAFLKRDYKHQYLADGFVNDYLAVAHRQAGLITVPLMDGVTITADGKFDELAWQKAKKLQFDSIAVYMLQSEEEFLIGIRHTKGRQCYTDLFLKSDSIVNLHASMQLGERNLKNAGDNVEWQWGNNKLWKANTVRYKKNAKENQPFKDQVDYYEGQEFVIRKEKFSNPQSLQLNISVGDFVNGEFKAVYPGKEKWLALKLINSPVLSGGKAAAAIDKMMEDASKRDLFNGVITVIDKGEIVYNKGFGYADAENKVQNDTNTVFNLCSISKQFTSMAIMLLKEAGQLDYNTELVKYFPELPYSKINIRHLLNHTSGLPDYMTLAYSEWPEGNVYANREAIELLVKHKSPALFGPGEKFQYSNTGYMLLASIVEKVSGKSYGDFLNENIFKPLGMNRTFVYTPQHAAMYRKHIAKGYVFERLKAKNVLADESVQFGKQVKTIVYPAGDGGVFSTAIDMIKWYKALISGRLISHASQQEAFTTGKLNDGKDAGYGFGWFIVSDPAYGKVMHHTGGWPGFRNAFIITPAKQRMLLVLRNTEIEFRGIQPAVNNMLDNNTFTLPQTFLEQAFAMVPTSSEASVIREIYNQLKERATAREDEINDVGYGLLQRGLSKHALEIMKINAELFPNSWKVYDSLGELHLKNGDRENARLNYRKSLTINPGNGGAKKALAGLQ